MTDLISAEGIEQAISTYIQECNNGNANAIAACFCTHAVHYFPGIKKWLGAGTIGANFAKRVHELGQYWSVDQILVDVDRCAAALEWTQFDRNDRVVRGVDWFVFDPETMKIREVRPYVAAFRPDQTRQELQDFDYAGRGYPTHNPRR